MVKRLDLSWATEASIEHAPLKEAKGGPVHAGDVFIDLGDGTYRAALPHEIPPHVRDLAARARAGEFTDAD